MPLPEDISALLLRPATAEDIPAITAIYAHHVRHGCASFEIEPPDMAEMRRRQDALLAQDMPYLVLEQDGVVLGYAYAGPYRPRPAYRDTVENSIYVRADQAGRGHGRRLLAALIEACEARGLRQMVAVVGDSANAASIGLHRALGFREVGVLRAVGWKHGQWLDSVLLQRALGPGESTPPVPRA
ncbi:GNAT family N-acetyltransferase [Roseomonas sp. E05]|uniref:GNAT family N-acetyltransferase n=1 Tax=Roseomonas sp. E05 TaxID=3046310 RepID=UPI0024BAB981|nr:GNAT family N-acetyltransferase [Roseomonas sp. E05]MDJ0387637.1 GNAT family N-acetyltransferase [Roseomonas sp. E05]